MNEVIQKIKPASGVSHVLHLGLLFVLPVAVFSLVRLEFVALAYAVVVLSKWRMLAVRPRFWAANIRANSVDLMVGLSMVVFISHSTELISQLVWVLIYAIWLIALKPGKSIESVMAQAFAGQLVGLSALYKIWSDAPIWALTLLTGLICFLAARHFLDNFDEPYSKMLSYIWGYFGAALAWVLSHWLLFYRGVSQVTLLLSTLGYGAAALYYFDHNDKLSRGLKRQFIFIMLAIIVVVLAFSDWGDKAL